MFPVFDTDNSANLAVRMVAQAYFECVPNMYIPIFKAEFHKNIELAEMSLIHFSFFFYP